MNVLLLANGLMGDQRSVNALDTKAVPLRLDAIDQLQQYNPFVYAYNLYRNPMYAMIRT